MSKTYGPNNMTRTQQYDYVRAACIRGDNCKSIAYATGLHIRNITDNRKNLGLPVRRIPKISKLYLKKLRNLRETGMTITDIAKQEKKAVSTVHEQLVKSGCKVQTMGKEFAVRIVEILQERGKPVHSPELYCLYITKHGNDVTRGTFQSRLIRFECARKLHNVTGCGYWPKEDPIPDVT